MFNKKDLTHSLKLKPYPIKRSTCTFKRRESITFSAPKNLIKRKFLSTETLVLNENYPKHNNND